MTRWTLLRLAALLSLLAPLPAPAQIAAPPPAAAGYHWRTLALRHAVPSEILALLHWNGPAAPVAPAPFDLLPLTGFPVPNPPALPDGVRRIFALQSNNSLLVQATEGGFAKVAGIVKVLDSSPRQVEFHMTLVAVPAARADLYAPDVPASQLLTLLLAGRSRVIPVSTETVTEGTGANVSVEVPATPSYSRFRLAQARPMGDGHGLSARCEFRFTPRVNADGTVTLRVTLTSGEPLTPLQDAPPRTVRAGEMTAYEVTGGVMGAAQAGGARLFLFVTPMVVADTEDAPNAGQPVSGHSVTVTP